MTRTEALAKHLECSVDDVEPSTYDEDTFEAEGMEFLVLTDKDADQKTEDHIKETVWAFNAWFIASHCPEGIEEDTIKLLQEKCEDANVPLLRMLKDFPDFVDDAVSCDGRGHFLSGYDGDEIEVDEYFIYRTN